LSGPLRCILFFSFVVKMFLRSVNPIEWGLQQKKDTRNLESISHLISGNEKKKRNISSDRIWACLLWCQTYITTTQMKNRDVIWPELRNSIWEREEKTFQNIIIACLFPPINYKLITRKDIPRSDKDSYFKPLKINNLTFKRRNVTCFI
jgi:hypothetical protein